MHAHDAQFGKSETGDCKLDTLNTVISGEGDVEARSTGPDEETDLVLVGRATLWRCFVCSGCPGYLDDYFFSA